MMEWDGSRQQNAARRGWVSRGWFYKRWAPEVEGPAHTLEASGGAAAYRRSMYVELGGFDSLFRPGYFEDFDISWRAWARGWRCVYEPRSVVYHRESVTFTEVFGNDRRARIHMRNHLLFTVKNIGGLGFVALFFALLPIRAIRPLLRGDASMARAFVDALPRFAAALRARRREAGSRHRDTRAILAASERPLSAASATTLPQREMRAHALS